VIQLVHPTSGEFGDAKERFTGILMLPAEAGEMQGRTKE
jgi:hypothetical protein